MSPLSRRSCLQRLAFALPATLLPGGRCDAREPTPEESAAISAIVRKFMADFEIPGLSIAFARREKFVFRAAYGHASEKTGESLTPEHTFRIASISKPLTAVAVFGLIEQGKLALDDKVFGPDGHLKGALDGKASGRLADVTLHHLLTHTAGGWGNDRDDPMFQHPDLDHAGLIDRTVRHHPLKHDPGTIYAYSNFGYCLLGRILEKISGKPYVDYLRTAVLERCGIQRMTLAGNTLDERALGEVVYHGRQGEDPYSMNVRRMDSHGGWIASASDLMKFLIRADGFAECPDLLREATRKDMFRATPANAGYANGWAVNKVPNHWHGGSLPGTSTIAVTTASGLCWAGLANARAPGVAPALDHLMWEIVKAVPDWTR